MTGNQRRSLLSLFLSLAAPLVSVIPKAVGQAVGTVNIWQSAGGATFNVTGFTPWNGYRIPNGLWLSGDFNGDSLTDLIHLVQNTDYAHVWIARRGGGFRVGQFRPWSGYMLPNGEWWRTGDFNADGRTDLIHPVPNTNQAHIWLSNGDGTFRVVSFSPGAGYVIPNGLWETGDFDGDRRTDVLHIVQNTNYTHVWLSNGDGTFRVTAFSPWGDYAMPNGVWWRVGDFNGDGRADVVHLVPNTDYAHVWLATGGGRFSVRQFRPWSGYAIPNGLWLTGDFNADGRADLAHLVSNETVIGIRPVATVHLWLSNGDGTFRVTAFNPPAANYVIPNGLWRAADFDGDRRTDLIHLVQNTDYAHVWTSNGDGTFAVAQFRPWGGYVIPNGLWEAGDFNGDRRGDVIHLVKSERAEVHALAVTRYATTELTSDAARRILSDATAVLRRNDGPGDVSCDVGLTLAGDVGTFNAVRADVGGGEVPFDGSIDNEVELYLVMRGVPGYVRVVEDIFWCPGGGYPSFAGCGIPWLGMVVWNQSTPTDGQLWAHEFGHTRTLWHRGEPDAVMYGEPLTAGSNKVNDYECFMLRPGASLRDAIEDLFSSPAPAKAQRMDVRQFVRRTFVEGLPYDHASAYGVAAVPTLFQMLADPKEEQYWPNVALVLGIVGDERVVGELIAFLSRGAQGVKLSRAHYRAKATALMALGYLAHRTKSQRALAYLREGVDPGVWARRGVGWASPYHTAADRDLHLTEMAVVGLGLSGAPTARQILQSLQQPATGEADRRVRAKVKDTVSEALKAHDKITRDGLAGYYRKPQRR